ADLCAGVGGAVRTVAERRQVLRAVFRLGGVEPDRGREQALQALVRHLLRLAAREGVVGRCAERRHTIGNVVLRRGRAHSAGTATGSFGAATFLPDLAGGTSRSNSRAALRPRMLRLACSLRNGSLVIELGASKSQCGQSEP